MTLTKMHRISLATALFSVVFGAAAIAAAEAPAGHRAHEGCGGDHAAMTPEERAQHRAERFHKSDKNGDGFLTEDEVGARRWEHLKVADADADGKVSMAEMDQAFKDGKLGHHGKHRDDDKSTRS